MKKKSATALVFCYLLILYVGVVFSPRWAKNGSEVTISWDVSGYYMYLPAIFIYHDLKHCAFKDSILSKYAPTPDFQQAIVHPSGNYVMKYSSGQAILMAPAFFTGHMIAKRSGTYPADGFSYPYQLSIGLLMMLYAFIGLFVLRKVLLYYFTDATVALTLVAIVFGSNYLNYAAVDQAMTHNSLFTLYALLLLGVIKFYQSPSLRRALGIGLLTGLITLVRPSEIICLMLPILWGIFSAKDLKDRLTFFRRKPGLLLAAACVFALVVFIQPLYWKIVSGDWLVYSYKDEGFSWLHPHFKEYLFGPRSGWLRYTPMLFFAVLGLIPLYKRRINFWTVTLFFVIDLYIVSAWDIWWYGGRAMIQSYPVLFFSVAAFIDYLNDGKWLKWFFYPFYALAVYLNFWWTYNAHAGNVQVTDVSNEYYWEMVGRWHSSDNDLKLLDNPDRYRRDTSQGMLLYQNNFAKDTSASLVLNAGAAPSLVLDPGHPASAAYLIPLPPEKARWIRATADIAISGKEWNLDRMPQFVLNVTNKGQTVRSRMIRLHRFFDGSGRKNISIDLKLPEEAYDQISLQFLNSSSDQQTFIGNLRVIAY